MCPAQKPHRRQLNAKVCGSKKHHFSYPFFFLVKTMMFNNNISKMLQVLSVTLAQNSYHSTELCDYSASAQLQIHPGQQRRSQHFQAAVRCIRHHLLNLYACAHIRSLIPRSMTKVNGLEAMQVASRQVLLLMLFVSENLPHKKYLDCTAMF